MKIAKTPSFIGLILALLTFAVGFAGADCPAGQVRDHSQASMPCVPDPAANTNTGKTDNKTNENVSSDADNNEVKPLGHKGVHDTAHLIAQPIPSDIQKALNLNDEQYKALEGKWPGAAKDVYDRVQQMQNTGRSMAAFVQSDKTMTQKTASEEDKQERFEGWLDEQGMGEMKGTNYREIIKELQDKTKVIYSQVKGEGGKRGVLAVGADYQLGGCAPQQAGNCAKFRGEMGEIENGLEAVSLSEPLQKWLTKRHDFDVKNGHDLLMTQGGGHASHGGRNLGGGGSNTCGKSGGQCRVSDVMSGVDKSHWEDNANQNPSHPGYNNGAGRDILEKNPSGARDYFNRTLDTDPKNADALSGRALANYKLNNFPAANADAKGALALNPQDASSLAVSKLTDERGAGAMPSVANLGAQDSSAFSGGSGGGANRGIAGGRDAHYADFNRQSARALSLRDYKEASAQASLAINSNPKNAQAYNYRAMANLGLRDYSKALADASAGLKLAPRNIPLLNSKAQAMLRMKNYKGALDAANEALAINSKDAASLAQKAYALGAMGDREAMLAALRQAAAIDPRYNSSLQSALQLPADSDVMFLFPGEEGLAGAGGVSGIFGKGRRFGLLGAAALAGGLLLAFGLMPIVLPSLSKKFQTFASYWGQVSPAVSPASVLDDIPVEGQPLLRGQYQLGEQIGSGGMGVVFAGLDVTLDRRVAVKRLRAEFAADRRERERFIAEAKTVAGLKHPNIVEIYAIVEEDSDVFLIFEHIPGGTLFDRIAKQGPMSHFEGLAVLKQISAALEYAHSKGIIHRDLKPSNVMFDSDGRVKVMDFGIARVAKDAMNRFTLTNTVVGTPPYMAPEQEQGVVGRQADVYSLAVCYYEMLSGRLPFTGTSAGLLVNKMNMNYKPITEVVPGLPPALDDVFAGAFIPDPEKRPGSPSELLAAIESVPVA